MRVWSRLLMLLLVLALGGPVFAQLAQPAEKAMAVELVPETRSAAPGQRLTLALKMRPKPGWHGYWKNPGDAGAETRIAWRLPDGVTAGPIQYPVPDRLIVSGLMNYVYKGAYSHLIDLDIPAGLAPGTKLPLRARVDYLVCTDRICVPESADVAAEVSIGGEGGRTEAMDRLRQALPRPLGSEGRFERKGEVLRIAIPLPATLAIDDPYFFPVTDGALEYSAPQKLSRSGDLLIIETRAAPDAPPPLIQGVLKIGDDQGLALTARPGAVPAAGLALEGSEPSGAGQATLIGALAAAFIGGLLLNIMPCVFPILSLKALSLAKVGGDEAEARREAIAYGLGAVLICLALGALLLSLRAGGATIGWAFQLQDPRVILFLLLLVTVIALNLAGLFDLPSIRSGDRLTRSGGVAGAFWTGALAAFVATPCTGPFMGAALGAALVLPAEAGLAVFAGLGLGLAFPFLLLGFVPPLRRGLPKPGPWMGRFRRLMSLPMFLTAIGLVWILSRQSGTEGMLLGLAAAAVIGIALWWVGRTQGERRSWLPLAPAAAAAAVAIFLVPTATAPAAAKGGGALAARPFSEQRLAALQAEGRPVFVYFTADWCVTCKVNEKAVLERDDVARDFEDRNVAVLVGDWTRGDASIGRFLEKHGRTGVPLYLYYAPGKPAEILPQILTTGRLTSLGG